MWPSEINIIFTNLRYVESFESKINDRALNMSGCRAVYLDHVDLGASAGGQLSSQFSHLYLETLSREYNMPCSKSLLVDQFCAILAGEMGSTLTTSVYVAIRSVRVCPYVDPEN